MRNDPPPGWAAAAAAVGINKGTPGQRAKDESDAQKIKRYEAAFDQILARPPYPVALRVAQEARHPTTEEKK